jgi:hypothetical protein
MSNVRGETEVNDGNKISLVSRLTPHVSRVLSTNKRQEKLCRRVSLRLLVLLRPNNKQIRLWRKVKAK